MPYKKLAAVFAKINQPKFDAENPHFKNKFASLKACDAAVRKACIEVGGCGYNQKIAEDNKTLETIFYTDEGNTVTLSTAPILAGGNNAQQFGSAQTYARRYGLCAAFGLVADADDDGEQAVQATEHAEQQQADRNAAKANAWGWIKEWAKLDGRDSMELLAIASEQTGVDVNIAGAAGFIEIAKFAADQVADIKAAQNAE